MCSCLCLQRVKRLLMWSVVLIEFADIVYIACAWKQHDYQCVNQLEMAILGVYLTVVLQFLSFYCTESFKNKFWLDYKKYRGGMLFFLFCIIVELIGLLYCCTYILSNELLITQCTQSTFEAYYVDALPYFGIIFALAFMLYTRSIVFYISTFYERRNVLLNQSLNRLMLQRGIRNNETIDSFFQSLVDNSADQSPSTRERESSIIRENLPKRSVNPEEHLVNCCVICLEDFNKDSDEEICELPSCHHTFHYKCIDKWLTQSFLCPYCRTDVQATS